MNEKIKEAHSRDYYKCQALELEHMKSFDGGSLFVESIVSEWKDKYKNRRALMDELKRVSI